MDGNPIDDILTSTERALGVTFTPEEREQMKAKYKGDAELAFQDMIKSTKKYKNVDFSYKERLDMKSKYKVPLAWVDVMALSENPEMKSDIKNKAGESSAAGYWQVTAVHEPYIKQMFGVSHADFIKNPDIQERYVTERLEPEYNRNLSEFKNIAKKGVEEGRYKDYENLMVKGKFTDDQIKALNHVLGSDGASYFLKTGTFAGSNPERKARDVKRTLAEVINIRQKYGVPSFLSDQYDFVSTEETTPPQAPAEKPAPKGAMPPGRTVEPIIDWQKGTVTNINPVTKKPEPVKTIKQEKQKGVTKKDIVEVAPGVVQTIDWENAKTKTEVKDPEKYQDYIEESKAKKQPETLLPEENSLIYKYFGEEGLGFVSAIKRGLNSGEIADILALGRTPTKEEMRRIAELQKENMQQKPSQAYNDFLNSEGFSDAITIFAQNPFEVLTQLATESLVAQLRHGLSRAVAGAGVGAGLGATALGAGALPGAGVGFLAGMSVAGLNLEVSASVLEALQEAGIDVTDPKSLEEGFANEELMTQAREFAYKRGVPIAVFDAISGGIAGKFFARPASTIAGKVLRGGAEMGTQMGLSAAGETAAQIASGQELNTTAILAEALGEIGGGLPEIAVGTAIEAKRLGKKTKDLLFGIDLPKKNFEDMVDISEGAGQITQQEADELKAEFDDVQKVKEKVPEDYRSNKVIFDLIEERDRLTQEMGKVDPIFEAEYKQKIEDINKKIQEETVKQKQADRVPTKKEFSDVVYATMPKEWQDMSKEEAWKSFQELTVQDQIKFFNTATGKKEEVTAPSTTAAGLTKEQQTELDKVNKRVERIQRTLQEDTEVQEEGDEPLLTAEQKKILETELQTLNQRRDAIQKQSTAAVPVQPGAEGRQGVGGQVQAKPEGPARKGEEAKAEGEKTRKVTNVSIEPPVDEDGEVDYEAEDAVRQIAKSRNLGITRDREIASVARDENGNIVGGAFTSYDDATGEYTFDVVVSEDYDGTGIGSKLLDSVINLPSDIKDMNPKAKVKVDVVNPRMKNMLEQRGFKVTKKIGDDRFIMEPSKKAPQATKAAEPTPTPTTTEKVAQKAAEAPQKANIVQGVELTKADGTKTAPAEYRKNPNTGKWGRVNAKGGITPVSSPAQVKQLEDALSSQTKAAAETKKTEPTPAKIPNALKDVQSTTKALEGQSVNYINNPGKFILDFIGSVEGKNLNTNWADWFLGESRSAKNRVAFDIQSNPKLSSALMSNLYDLWKKETKSDVPFEKFIDSEITLYRGGKEGFKNEVDVDGFNTWELTKEGAKKFAKDGDVIEKRIPVKNLYGAVDIVGGEIEVLEKTKISDKFAKEIFERPQWLDLVSENLNRDEVSQLKILTKQDKYNQALTLSKRLISEAYHKAKKDGSNPALVKAVEDLLGVAPSPPAAAQTSKAQRIIDEQKKATQLSKEISNKIKDIMSLSKSMFNRFGVKTRVVDKKTLQKEIRAKFKDLAFSRTGAPVIPATKPEGKISEKDFKDLKNLADELGFTLSATRNKTYAVYLDNLTGTIYYNTEADITNPVKNLQDLYGADSVADLKNKLEEILPEGIELMDLQDNESSFYIAIPDLDIIQNYKDLVNFDKLSEILFEDPKNLDRDLEIIRKYASDLDWLHLSYNPSLNPTPEMLREFKDFWLWGGISSNPNLNPTPEMLREFKNEWYWAYLSRFQNIDLEMLRKFKNEWDWYELSQKPSLNPTPEMLREFKDEWHWSSLSRNPSLNPSLGLLKEFKDEWSWGYLSRFQNIDLEMLREFKDEWDWGGISQNPSLNPTVEMLREFKDEWSWIELSQNPSLNPTVEMLKEFKDEWDWIGISNNPSLKSTFKLISKFRDKWDWSVLSYNPNLNPTPLILRGFEDKWDWYELSQKPNLNPTPEMLREFKNEWHWSGLSRNPSLNPSLGLLKEFKNKWNWYGISQNPSLNPTIEMLREFKGEWDWSNLSENPSLNPTPEMLREFKDELDWSGISGHKNFNITKEIADEFKDYIDWTEVSRQNKLKPWHLDYIKIDTKTQGKAKFTKLSSVGLPTESVRHYFPLFTGKSPEQIINYWADTWKSGLTTVESATTNPDLINSDVKNDYKGGGFVVFSNDSNFLFYSPEDNYSVPTETKKTKGPKNLKYATRSTAMIDPSMIREEILGMDQYRVGRDEWIIELSPANIDYIQFNLKEDNVKIRELTSNGKNIWEELGGEVNSFAIGTFDLYLENYTSDKETFLFALEDLGTDAFDKQHPLYEDGKKVYQYLRDLVINNKIDNFSGNTKVPDFLQNLNDEFGIEIRVTSPDGKKTTTLPRKTINTFLSKSEGEVWGFYDNKLKEAVLRSDAPMEATVHEAFTHPFLEAAKVQNPKLYNSLLKQAAAKKEIKESVDKDYKDKTRAERNDEYIARAIDKYVKGELDAIKDKGLIKAILDFFKNISDNLKSFLDLPTSVKDISPNTTLKELAQYSLYGKGTIDLTTQTTPTAAETQVEAEAEPTPTKEVEAKPTEEKVEVLGASTLSKKYQRYIARILATPGFSPEYVDALMNNAPMKSPAKDADVRKLANDFVDNLNTLEDYEEGFTELIKQYAARFESIANNYQEANKGSWEVYAMQLIHSRVVDNFSPQDAINITLKTANIATTLGQGLRMYGLVDPALLHILHFSKHSLTEKQLFEQEAAEGSGVTVQQTIDNILEIYDSATAEQKEELKKRIAKEIKDQAKKETDKEKGPQPPKAETPPNEEAKNSKKDLIQYFDSKAKEYLKSFESRVGKGLTSGLDIDALIDYAMYLYYASAGSVVKAKRAFEKKFGEKTTQENWNTILESQQFEDATLDIAQQKLIFAIDRSGNPDEYTGVKTQNMTPSQMIIQSLSRYLLNKNKKPATKKDFQDIIKQKDLDINTLSQLRLDILGGLLSETPEKRAEILNQVEDLLVALSKDKLDTIAAPWVKKTVIRQSIKENLDNMFLTVDNMIDDLINRRVLTGAVVEEFIQRTGFTKEQAAPYVKIIQENIDEVINKRVEAKINKAIKDAYGIDIVKMEESIKHLTNTIPQMQKTFEDKRKELDSAIRSGATKDEVTKLQQELKSAKEILANNKERLKGLKAKRKQGATKLEKRAKGLAKVPSFEAIADIIKNGGLSDENIKGIFAESIGAKNFTHKDAETLRALYKRLDESLFAVDKKEAQEAIAKFIYSIKSDNDKELFIEMFDSYAYSNMLGAFKTTDLALTSGYFTFTFLETISGGIQVGKDVVNLFIPGRSKDFKNTRLVVDALFNMRNTQFSLKKFADVLLGREGIGLPELSMADDKGKKVVTNINSSITYLDKVRMRRDEAIKKGEKTKAFFLNFMIGHNIASRGLLAADYMVTNTLLPYAVYRNVTAQAMQELKDAGLMSPSYADLRKAIERGMGKDQVEQQLQNEGLTPTITTKDGKVIKSEKYKKRKAEILFEFVGNGSNQAMIQSEDQMRRIAFTGRIAGFSGKTVQKINQWFNAISEAGATKEQKNLGAMMAASIARLLTSPFAGATFRFMQSVKNATPFGLLQLNKQNKKNAFDIFFSEYNYYNVYTGEVESVPATVFEKEQRVAMALIPTVVAMSVLSSVFDFDDEEDIKIKDDGWLFTTSYSPAMKTKIETGGGTYEPFAIYEKKGNRYERVMAYKDYAPLWFLAGIGRLQEKILFDQEAAKVGEQVEGQPKDPLTTWEAFGESIRSLMAYATQGNLSSGAGVVGGVAEALEGAGGISYPIIKSVQGLVRQMIPFASLQAEADNYYALLGAAKKEGTNKITKTLDDMILFRPLFNNTDFDLLGEDVVKGPYGPPITTVTTAAVQGLGNSMNGSRYSKYPGARDLITRHPDISPIRDFKFGAMSSSDYKGTTVEPPSDPQVNYDLLRAAQTEKATIIEEQYDKLTNLNKLDLEKALEKINRDVNSKIKLDYVKSRLLLMYDEDVVNKLKKPKDINDFMVKEGIKLRADGYLGIQDYEEAYFRYDEQKPE